MSHGERRRFTFVERVVHWVAGLSFVFLLLTGLAFSHPRLFWITSFAGGGPGARIAHPWAGVLFEISLVTMVALWAKDMRIAADDRAWLRAIRHYLVHDRDRVPAAGKYNAGQKLFFWAMGALAALFVVSGVAIWFPGGVLGMGPFYGAVVNGMRLLHYLATVAGGLLLIAHVYLGTVAYPGTLGGMLHGSVSRSWAKLHHPAWKEEEPGA